MNEGFITALGTPLNDDGDLVAKSFTKQIDDQIDSGASALLAMGTMGNEAYIRDSVYPRVARVAVEAARGRVPVFVGVMDCSITRVAERIAAIGELGIDGVVATAPYYLKTTQEEIRSFFSGVAKRSRFPLYLYDLAPVTQTAIEPGTVLDLARHPNIFGIKSGVMTTCRILSGVSDLPAKFTVMYSGLDTFDVAWTYGMRRQLDGMFACTPALAQSMYRALSAGSVDEGRRNLDRILDLRNTFVSIGVMKGFTVAMNLLGYAGSFAPDYVVDASEGEREFIEARMRALGAL
jgi:4-hydroxy-tetrahydrodipicolinate synthase